MTSNNYHITCYCTGGNPCPCMKRACKHCFHEIYDYWRAETIEKCCHCGLVKEDEHGPYAPDKQQWRWVSTDESTADENVEITAVFLQGNGCCTQET